MKNLTYLVEHNALCLQQGIALLEQLPDDVYVYTEAPIYTSSIGDHYRHCLEHYTCFLSGIQGARIDYDARKRDLQIATERTYALEITRRVIAGLQQLTPADASLKVKMDCKLSEEDGAVWTDSTVERDLQYLQAHTIHHYALIAMIARLQGVDPGDEFGVAPSTLSYRKRQLQEV